MQPLFKEATKSRVAIVSVDAIDARTFAATIASDGFAPLGPVFAKGDLFEAWRQRQAKDKCYSHDDTGDFSRFLSYMDTIAPEKYSIEIRFNHLRVLSDEIDHDARMPQILTLLNSHGFDVAGLVDAEPVSEEERKIAAWVASLPNTDVSAWSPPDQN